MYTLPDLDSLMFPTQLDRLLVYTSLTQSMCEFSSEETMQSTVKARSRELLQEHKRIPVRPRKSYFQKAVETMSNKSLHDANRARKSSTSSATRCISLASSSSSRPRLSSLSIAGDPCSPACAPLSSRDAALSRCAPSSLRE